MNDPEQATPDPQSQAGRQAPRRPDWRFMVADPARLIALGFGSGLSPKAPGTVGTLWAWLTFAVLDGVLPAMAWPPLLLAGAVVGGWACTRCAVDLGIADPGAIVWDEVLAFWALLWAIAPAGWTLQLLAFALFRLFDIAKPGPIGWTDRRFKLRPGEAIGARQGLGILLDDLVAAVISLGVLGVICGSALVAGHDPARWP
jgi:phosphatidylglycerophosphatase A